LATEEFECLGPTQIGRRDSSEGHLVDPELAVRGPKGATELLLLLDGEPGVLGREHRLGGRETLCDVGDRLDLLRSWHCLLLAWCRRRESPNGNAPDVRPRGSEKTLFATCAGGLVAIVPEGA